MLITDPVVQTLAHLDPFTHDRHRSIEMSGGLLALNPILHNLRRSFDAIDGLVAHHAAAAAEIFSSLAFSSRSLVAALSASARAWSRNLVASSSNAPRIL